MKAKLSLYRIKGARRVFECEAASLEECVSEYLQSPIDIGNPKVGEYMDHYRWTMLRRSYYEST